MLFVVIFFGFSGICFGETLSEINKTAKGAVIECSGLIDDGLYKSIIRRSEAAIADGADYLFFKISTYGGLVKSADDISKYFILDLGGKVRTIAYIETEAISAGAMISVSCQDIIMRENTLVGDCAPIVMGQKLEGVEREKAETFIRETFARAAQANGYPEILLKAMVTDRIKVYRIKNIAKDTFEFFDADALPKDANEYDLANIELIDKDDQILTLTAQKAYDYGIARAVVKDINEAYSFIESRDGVVFENPPKVYDTNWSEELVRFLTSPTVTGILFMVALLGVYIEVNTPGIGLPSLVAVVCFGVIFGSRFLIDLANWVEVAIFAIGVILLLIEIFVIPGFGLTGFFGIVLIIVGLFATLVKNAPDQLPIPQNPLDWQDLQNGALGLLGGFVGFLILAWWITKYLPEFEFFSGLALKPYSGGAGANIVMTADSAADKADVKVGDIGVVRTILRPSGTADFGGSMVDVLSEAEFIEIGNRVKIVKIEGNRVFVEKVSGDA